MSYRFVCVGKRYRDDRSGGNRLSTTITARVSFTLGNVEPGGACTRRGQRACSIALGRRAYAPVVPTRPASRSTCVPPSLPLVAPLPRSGGCSAECSGLCYAVASSAQTRRLDSPADGPPRCCSGAWREVLVPSIPLSHRIQPSSTHLSGRPSPSSQLTAPSMLLW